MSLRDCHDKAMKQSNTGTESFLLTVLAVLPNDQHQMN
jgi:hypothetical protein